MCEATYHWRKRGKGTMRRVVVVGLMGFVARAAFAAAPETAATVEGPTWRLRSLGEMDERELAAAPRGVTARFSGGRVEGSSGCNQYGGTYTIEGDRLTVGQVAGTMMACPEPQMKVENAFRAAFIGQSRFSTSGSRLTLAAANGATLVFEAEPSPTLEGVTWDVSGYDNGKGAVASPLAGTELTVVFRAGTVTGHAGCNHYRAAYTIEGNRISIGAAAATRKACPGHGVMAQEQQFLEALQSAATYTVRGAELELHRADGARVLIARGRHQ
jgi:heat shock protein HslJ